MPSQGYVRYPTIYRDHIIFVSEDDLWLISSEGGRAERLTAGVAEASYPRFSPDGALLALWVAKRVPAKSMSCRLWVALPNDLPSKLPLLAASPAGLLAVMRYSMPAMPVNLPHALRQSTPSVPGKGSLASLVLAWQMPSRMVRGVASCLVVTLTCGSFHTRNATEVAGLDTCGVMSAAMGSSSDCFVSMGILLTHAG